MSSEELFPRMNKTNVQIRIIISILCVRAASGFYNIS
jgi:hypothetical protein